MFIVLLKKNVKINTSNITNYKLKDFYCERHIINVLSLGWVRIKEKGHIPTTEDRYVIKSGHVSIKADRCYVPVLIEIPMKELGLTLDYRVLRLFLMEKLIRTLTNVQN